MPPSATPLPLPRPLPRSLFAFAIFYGGVVCIAGVLGNKQVTLGPVSRLGPMFGLPPLAVEAGIFAFLLLIATSSAVAELHGRAAANFLVLVGFAPLIFSILLTLAVLQLPAAQEMPKDRLAAFNTMMGATPWIWLGGIIGYGLSQMLNVTVFSWLKGREGNSLLWFRAAVASVLSQIVDTLLFITIAFGIGAIGWLMAGQMLAKILLSIVLVPILITAMVGFGRWLDT